MKHLFIFLFGIFSIGVSIIVWYCIRNVSTKASVDVFENRVKQSIDTFVDSVTTYSDEDYFVFAELYHYGKFGKNKNSYLAVENYKKCIEVTKNDELKGLCYLGLAKLYENEAIINIDNIITSYLKALECGYEESVLHIGKIYLHGIHPNFLPDKMLAARIFSTFIQFSPSLHPWCKLHLQEIHTIDYTDLDALKQNDIVYKQLPMNIVNHIQHAASKINTLIPYKTNFNQNWLQNYDDDLDELENDFENTLIQKVPRQIITNDTQNVHDHSLQNIGNTILDILEKNPEKNTNFYKNVNHLYSHLDETKYSNVKKVCDSYGDLVHSKYDKSEQEVFNLVWSKAQNNTDMIDMLLDNINSSVENENVVCSTGKIMRMLSTLDVLDKDTPDLKPEWVIKDEITQTISKVLKDLSPKEQKEYESDDDEHIKTIIKQRIRKKCEKDYKDILDSNVLDIYLNNYFEFI